MEEKIRQLEERISKLEKPTRLTDEWRKVLIAEGFLKYEKELLFTSGANIEIINIFVKIKDDIYVLSALPDDYFKEFSVDITDDEIVSKNHGLSDDKQVLLYSTGTLPAGLSNGISYWVVNPTQNNFQLSLTSLGSPINITDRGIGTHYWQYFT